MSVKFTVTLKDFELTYFSGSGAGGQHRNKHKNCVRLRHPETGVITTGQNHRERAPNLQDALRRMVEHHKFKFFCEQKLKELEGQQSIEKWVEEQMQPEHIEVFTQKGNKMVSEATGEVLDNTLYETDRSPT